MTQFYELGDLVRVTRTGASGTVEAKRLTAGANPGSFVWVSGVSGWLSVSEVEPVEDAAAAGVAR